MLVFRLIYGKEELVKDIIVADLNSTDDTMKILTRLSKEYDCIKTTKWRKCKEVMDNINESK